VGLTIKKNDMVVVTTGDEKGKKGRVLAVHSKTGSLVIERINMIKRHMKPSKKYSQGGIIEKEAPVRISNVMLVCTKCEAPTRIGHKVLESGTKVRLCKKCREVID
jgi:large subunit ribosomal protein L24